MEIQRRKNFKKDLLNKDSTYFREFIETTSTNGVARIFTKEYSAFRRFFWLVVFLGAAVGCIYDCIDRIIYLASSPTSTTVTVTRMQSLEFPAVTVCNLNYYEAGSLEDVGLLEEGIFGLNFNPTDPQSVDRCNAVIGSNPTAEEVVLEDLWRSSISRSSSDFISLCGFLGESCNMEKDFLYSSLGFGACYTFNGFSKMPPLETNGASSRRGLFLFLNINQSEYTASYFLDAGVRVFIHPSSEPAQILDQGISIPPGRVAFVGLRQENIVNDAGIDCVTSDDSSHFNFLANNFSYSASACLVDCQITAVADVCGCYHFTSDISPSSSKYTGIRDCTFNDSCCIQEVLSHPLNCTCTPSCVTSFYDASTSYSSLPAEYANKYFPIGNLDVDKNFIALSIYFQSDIVRTETTTFSYGFVALLSDIGGQWGLFLGISIITIVEFFVWVLDESCDRLCCCKISWKKREKNAVEKDGHEEVKERNGNSIFFNHMEKGQCPENTKTVMNA